MSEVKTCPNCGNLQARGKFCSQCGYDLSGVQVKPMIVGRSSGSKESYPALRFVSSLLIVMGWVIVIVTVATSCIFLSSAAGAGAIVSQWSSGVEKIIGATSSFAVVVATMAYLALGVGGGIFQVAAGQLILVVLDIRDDVRKISTK